MTKNRSYPPEDPRYGVAQASMLGLYAGFDEDREAYRKTGRLSGFVLGMLLGLAAVFLLVRDSGAVS
jgi:hypothetical protein